MDNIHTTVESQAHLIAHLIMPTKLLNNRLSFGDFAVWWSVQISAI